MVQSAQRRKTALRNLLDLEPRTALDFVLTEKERSILKSRTVGCVEEPATVRGTVSLIHADYPDNFSQSVPIITGDDGSTAALYPSSPTVLSEGDEVTATGYLLDAAFFFDVDTSDPTLAGTGSDNLEIISKANEPPPTLPVTVVRQTLALMVYFSNQTEPDAFPGEDDRAVVEQRMGRVNDFYIETSYGKLELLGIPPIGAPGGDVVDWFQVPITQSCNAAAVVTAARNAVLLLEPTLDLSAYNQTVVIAPFNNCPWSGLASGTGLALISTFRAGTDIRTIAHEIGHNLGLGHANFGNCGEESLAPACEDIDYGDTYDTMGRSSDPNSPRHFVVSRKARLGWLDSTRTLASITADANLSPQTYSLSPVASATPGIKGVKIQRSYRDFMFIEYRQPIGFDHGMDEAGLNNVFGGVLLHTYAFGGDGAGADGWKTWLIDATTGPGNPGSYRTSTLQLGEKFTDPLSGTEVLVTNIFPGARPEDSLAVVEVRPGSVLDGAPPVVSAAPLPNVVTGTITISATATSNVGLDRVDFKYLRPGTGNLTTFASLTSPNAGDHFEASLDTRTLPDGDLNLYVFAYDRFGWWTTWFQRVVVNNIPPDITILSPSDGTTVAGQVTIEAATRIEVPATERVEFFLDGASLGPGRSRYCLALTNPPPDPETAVCYWLTIDSTMVANGWHTALVRAYDTLGLEGDATIRILVDNRRPGRKQEFTE